MAIYLPDLRTIEQLGLANPTARLTVFQPVFSCAKHVQFPQTWMAFGVFGVLFIGGQYANCPLLMTNSLLLKIVQSRVEIVSFPIDIMVKVNTYVHSYLGKCDHDLNQ